MLVYAIYFYIYIIMTTGRFVYSIRTKLSVKLLIFCANPFHGSDKQKTVRADLMHRRFSVRWFFRNSYSIVRISVKPVTSKISAITSFGCCTFMLP